jgi:4-hydroxy-tetrahydrodipicolinate reductase
MTVEKIRVIQYGLGPIGIAAANLVLTKPGMEIVGAVDIAREMVGRDLGEILGRSEPLGVNVTDNAGLLFSKVKADAVIHTAGSRLKRIFGQLEEIIRGGKNIVSSSEELFYRSPESAELAAKIHRLALEAGVTVLGTGVNPGFVMDALPLTLTGVCHEVREVHVERVVDASTRRYPLQKKIGAGMTEDLFREKIAGKAMGHVGLLESLYLIGDRLRFAFDEVREAVDPMIAEKPLKTDYFELKPGDVAGIRHVAEGLRGGRKIVTLNLRMYIGAEDPHDAVRIFGSPDVNLRIDGGVAGDQATVAILVNSIPAVVAAQPGLATVTDLPAPYCLQP